MPFSTLPCIYAVKFLFDFSPLKKTINKQIFSSFFLVEKDSAFVKQFDYKRGPLMVRSRN